MGSCQGGGLTGNLDSLSVVRLNRVVVHRVPEEAENVEDELLLLEIGRHGVGEGEEMGVEGDGGSSFVLADRLLFHVEDSRSILKDIVQYFISAYAQARTFSRSRSKNTQKLRTKSDQDQALVCFDVSPSSSLAC